MIDSRNETLPAEFDVAMLVALDVVVANLELSSISVCCQILLGASPSIMADLRVCVK